MKHTRVVVNTIRLTKNDVDEAIKQAAELAKLKPPGCGTVELEWDAPGVCSGAVISWKEEP